MSIVGATVWVLTYSHKHGEDVSVYASEQGAKDAVADIAREYWSDFVEDEDPPEDDEACVERYFAVAGESMPYGEFYSIEQAIVGP